eukprot:TRINITY_DN10755_c0_g1_i1.p1 TRINITY_DN10755_c0_g1~~TRINITY_DN10755_c0_g1_i1.p1  ORF type:complete len:400 (+),score=80.24 TRINITY_DN10755_c0_g1_i1:73-1272(+)
MAPNADANTSTSSVMGNECPVCGYELEHNGSHRCAIAQLMEREFTGQDDDALELTVCWQKGDIAEVCTTGPASAQEDEGDDISGRDALEKEFPPGLRIRTRCVLAAFSKVEIPAGAVGRVECIRGDGVVTIVIDSENQRKPRCAAEPQDLIKEGFLSSGSLCTVNRLELTKGDQTLEIPAGTEAKIVSKNDNHTYSVKIVMPRVKLVCEVETFNVQPMATVGVLSKLKNKLGLKKTYGSESSSATGSPKALRRSPASSPTSNDVMDSSLTSIVSDMGSMVSSGSEFPVTPQQSMMTKLSSFLSPRRLKRVDSAAHAPLNLSISSQPAYGCLKARSGGMSPRRSRRAGTCTRMARVGHPTFVDPCAQTHTHTTLSTDSTDSCGLSDSALTANSPSCVTQN